MSAINGRLYVATGRTARARARGRHQLVRFIVLFDLLALLAAALVAWIVTDGELTRAELAWLLSATLGSLAVLSLYRLYEHDRQLIAVSTLDEIRDFANALCVLAVAQLTLRELLETQGVRTTSAAPILLFALLALIALPATRGFVRHVVIPRLNTPQNAVIFGAGRVGQSIAEKIRKHPEYNVRIVGFLDDEPRPLDRSLDDLPVLGREDELVDVLRRHRVSRVILTFSRRSHDQVLEVLRAAGLRDVQLSIVPRYFEIMASTIHVADVDGIPVLETPSARLSRMSLCVKRCFDLVVASLVLVLLAPLMLAIAALIKLESRGPVFFRQQRMGSAEQTFEIVKFRTMVDGAEHLREQLLSRNESSGPLFKLRSDPRVTPLGRRLRRWSLDELPQLFNVLRGEMSLVGPRPFVLYEDVMIDGWARRRLDLMPGITGPWQVLGRNEIPFEEMVKLDYIYVHTWSLWGDVKLLLQTVPIVLRRRGY